MVENVVIPQAHIEMLTENPDGFRLGFDGLHGEGAADRILSGAGTGMQEEDQSGFQKNSVVRDRTVVGKVWNNSFGAVAYGVQEGVNETIDSFGDLDDWYADKTRELGIKGYLEFGYETEEAGGRGFVFNFTHRPETGTMFFGAEGEEDNLEFNMVDAPTAMPGQMISGISQFATVYLSAGRVVKMGGLLGAMSKGAVADALAFDPKDPNVTAMISDVAGIEPNALTDLMATDVDDPNWQNRLRNVAEGALIGGVIEGAFYSLRAAKLARAGRADEAAEMTRAAIKASRKVEKAMAKDLENLRLEIDADLPPIAGDLRKAIDEELALRDAKGQQPTRGDLPTPRNPDQPDLPGLSSREPGSPDLGIRKLTEDELVQYREARMRADMGEPSDALRGTGITRPGAQSSWDEWQGHIGAVREVASDAWDKLPASQPQKDAHVAAQASLALKEMSVLLGEDPAALIQRFRELPIDPNKLPAEIVARGDVVKLLSNRVELSQMVLMT